MFEDSLVLGRRVVLQNQVQHRDPPTAKSLRGEPHRGAARRRRARPEPLGGGRAAPERSAFFGEEFRQVGVAEIDAGLREQGGDLPAMVNLV